MTKGESRFVVTHTPIPIEIYNGLHDFVMQHEIDIELEIDDFDLLKEVYEWICKKEGYE